MIEDETRKNLPAMLHPREILESQVAQQPLGQRGVFVLRVLRHVLHDGFQRTLAECVLKLRRPTRSDACAVLEPRTSN